MLSRKDIRPRQTRLLLERGFLPISVDYRLCPEVTITEGPMTDVCTALSWARNTLPSLATSRPDVRPDGSKVAVIGWSTGGTLSMTLPFTAPAHGVAPPDAVLAFYCPLDYESPFWREPNYPEKTTPEQAAQDYDILECVHDQPITAYNVVPTTEARATGGWMSLSDPRSRLVLHMNWKGQALPTLLGGLPTKKAAPADFDWRNRPQPDPAQVAAISPYAQIVAGTYKTPTFMIHGTSDDLVPWEHTQRVKDALDDKGVPAGVAIVEDAIHLFDLFPSQDGKHWEAVLKGYDFLCKQIGV